MKTITYGKKRTKVKELARVPFFVQNKVYSKRQRKKQEEEKHAPKVHPVYIVIFHPRLGR